MTPSTLLCVLFILPAFAYQNELDSVKERLKDIHDLPTLFKEIGREGERAVITIGILPAVKAFSANIERFLEANEDFALKFGGLARNALYLAHLYLNEVEIGPDAYEELADGVADFEEWMESMHQRGLITYDAKEPAPEFVGPGVDPSTEELRGIVRLMSNQTAEVPEDPVMGGELYLHASLPSRALAMLGHTPADADREEVDTFVQTARYFAALFRLSFRRPEKMRYEDWERELVVEYLQQMFEITRKGIEEGHFSPKYWKMAAEALERIKKWKQEREHEEL